MKISKHSHSCLLIEDKGKAILIDPGKHTYEEKLHERAFDLGEPPNIVFTLFNRLLHPGDCLSFNFAEIIAFPIYMAWGNLMLAVERVAALQPKVIIPIHDHPLREWNRLRIYERLDEYFNKQGIVFKRIENNESIIL